MSEHRNNDEGDDDYAVGYSRPPRGTRFKKGESGNPAGKAKGSRSLKADFEKELKTVVQVAEGGKMIWLTKQELLAKVLIAKATKGSVPAIVKAFDMTLAIQGDVGSADAGGALTVDDDAILAGYDWRRRQAVEEPE